MRPGDERLSALRLEAWELRHGEHEVFMGGGVWLAVLDGRVASRSRGIVSRLYLFLAGDRVVVTSPSTLWWARRMVAA